MDQRKVSGKRKIKTVGSASVSQPVRKATLLKKLPPLCEQQIAGRFGTEYEAAAFLGLSVYTLRKARVTGYLGSEHDEAKRYPPPLHRKFGRSVRYWGDDLIAWAKSHPAMISTTARAGA